MISLMFATALLAGAPTVEPTVAPAAPPAATVTVTPMTVQKAKPGPNEVVCKKEQVLGSRMKSRICMTQGEWDARRDQDRDDLTKTQTQKPLIF